MQAAQAQRRRQRAAQPPLRGLVVQLYSELCLHGGRAQAPHVQRLPVLPLVLRLLPHKAPRVSGVLCRVQHHLHPPHVVSEAVLVVVMATLICSSRSGIMGRRHKSAISTGACHAPTTPGQTSAVCWYCCCRCPHHPSHHHRHRHRHCPTPAASAAAAALSAALSLPSRRPEMESTQEGGSSASAAFCWCWCSDRR